jgi:hypothetical protein
MQQQSIPYTQPTQTQSQIHIQQHQHQSQSQSIINKTKPTIV